MRLEFFIQNIIITSSDQSIKASKHHSINPHIKTNNTNTHITPRLRSSFASHPTNQNKTNKLRNGILPNLSTIRCLSISPLSQERRTEGCRRREAAQQGGQRSVPGLLWREQLSFEHTGCCCQQGTGHCSAINLWWQEKGMAG